MTDWKPKWPLPFDDSTAVAPPATDDPTDAQRHALEVQLHQLDAEIGRLREQMLLLRGLERTPERQARMAHLAARYEELGARFVATYRAWNTLDRSTDDV